MFPLFKFTVDAQDDAELSDRYISAFNSQRPENIYSHKRQNWLVLLNLRVIFLIIHLSPIHMIMTVMRMDGVIMNVISAAVTRMPAGMFGEYTDTNKGEETYRLYVSKIKNKKIIKTFKN